MTPRDQFTQEQIASLLQPGEQIRNMAFVLKQPAMWIQMLLYMCCGWILILFLTKYYYAALTDRRLILVQTGMGFFSPKMENRAVTTIDLANVQSVTTGGFLNNRSFTFVMADGTKDEYRFAPWSKMMSGQGRWLEEIKTIRG
ncbi:MAG: hypothetical protein M3Y87_14555 [Myxococcota bacterium]|nr:hypothetical protein [Myxococcota bacterium]